MEEIIASIQINVAAEKLWSLVSDLDYESKLWNNISKVRNLSQEGNIIKREITIGKTDRCLQTVTLYPQQKIVAEFTKGIINGTKTTSMTPNNVGTTLEISWSIKFTGGAGFLKGMLIKSFQQQTEDVLQAIKQEAEGTGHKNAGPRMETRKHWADMIDSSE